MTTTKKEHQPDAAHAIYSPSAASRWVACPSSPRLTYLLRQEGRIPRDSDTAASKRGTFLHEVTSLWLAGKHQEAEAFAAKHCAEHDETFDDAMYLASTAAEHARACLNIVGDDLPDDVHLERRYSVTEPLNIHGTADVSRVTSDEVTICDFKFGAWTIQARDNKQLALYAYMAIMTLDRFLKPETPVTMCIIQPPLLGDNWHIDRWQISFREIWDIVSEATEAYLVGEAAFRGESEAAYNPGEEQCKFCPNRTHCPALAGLSQSLMEDKDMETMTSAQVAKFYDRLKLLSGVKEKIEDGVRGGTITEGFSTKPGARREAWAGYDSDEFQQLLEENDWDTDRIIDREARLPISKIKKNQPEIYERARELGAISETHNKERVVRVPLNDPDDVAEAFKK